MSEKNKAYLLSYQDGIFEQIKKGDFDFESEIGHIHKKYEAASVLQDFDTMDYYGFMLSWLNRQRLFFYLGGN
jgi:hypothetical protein